MVAHCSNVISAALRHSSAAAALVAALHRRLAGFASLQGSPAALLRPYVMPAKGHRIHSIYSSPGAASSTSSALILESGDVSIAVKNIQGWAQMLESGPGFTLSGKLLDPYCASARAYGLKPTVVARERPARTLHCRSERGLITWHLYLTGTWLRCCAHRDLSV